MTPAKPDPEPKLPEPDPDPAEDEPSYPVSYPEQGPDVIGPVDPGSWLPGAVSTHI